MLEHLNIKKIIIAGGGTAGFVSALILKTRFPDIDISLIRSEKIGIIGVGEGSTEHWNEFMNYIGIKWQSVIKYCDATFKSGIMFRGWNHQDYLHSTTPEFELKNGQYLYLYGRQIAFNQPKRSMNPPRTWNNKIFNHYLDSKSSPFNQYHFNTHKLNEFLTDIARFKGIDIIDDEILDISQDEKGNISTIICENKNYSADFFIDCTGFKKILISKLGAKWISYGKYLKMKSAIVFPTEQNLDNINLWTVSQAMKYGWMFTIPVWGRNGNGYIFDSDYIDSEKAKEEIEKFIGKKIEIGKQINFDPGALDKVWIKNCCAVGLSANFVEPLEATSIGTSIQQMFLLMHRLPNYDQQIIDCYNNDVSDILNNIRDFIILHYITNRDDSDFWKEIKNITIPDSLAEKLARWRKNLPIEDDFQKITKYSLFKESHHIHILNGLDLFDREKIKNEYNMMHHLIKEHAEDSIREIVSLDKITPSMNHKEFLETIRQKV